jgi:MFS family permease
MTTGPVVAVDLAPGRRTKTVEGRPADRTGRRAATSCVLLGALLGLTWGAALRGWMVQLVGPEYTLTWSGTFGALLAPAAVVGALLGWAEHLRRTGGARGRPWLVLAPLLLPTVVLAQPGALSLLASTGQGGGAVGMTLLAMAGGTAIAGRGRLWWRIPLGLLGFALVPAAYLGPPMRPALDVGTPLGAWAATLFATLFVTMALACATPLRADQPQEARP